MQSYDLWSENTMVGGLFPRTILMKNHEAMMTFKVLHKSFEKHNPWFLAKTLQITTRALGYQLTKEVKKTRFTLLDILGLPIFEA